LRHYFEQAQIVKSVGSKSPLGNYLRVATRAVAMVTVNKEIINHMVDFLVENTEEEEWELCSQIMELLQVPWFDCCLLEEPTSSWFAVGRSGHPRYI
jgi:hypothetical protein